MKQELVRTGLDGSALVGMLAQLALIDPPAAAPSLVEGLGRWLGWKEAIPLSAVLQQAAPGTAAALPVSRAKRAGELANVKTLQHKLNHVQADLTQAIMTDRDTVREDGNDFLPFRRRCLNLQQAMADAVRPLREQLRAQVARLTPAMAQLAALDAVVAQALAAREQALLALLPVLLEKHFLRLRSAPLQAEPKPWLDTFRHDMHQLLMAELSLRLQPSLGLLEALRGETQGLHE